MEIDDSALLTHASTYDPQKAREYYLRTRQLKGRRRGSGVVDTTPNRVTKKEFREAATGNEGKYAHLRPTNQLSNKLKKERLDALLNKLDRLRDLLRQKVAKAQARSGANTAAESKDRTTSKGSSKDSTDSKSSSKSGGGSKDKPATAKEKRDAAERAKKSYEKNKDKTPSKPDKSVAEEIKEVQDMIEDIRKQIKDATAQARKNASNKSKSSTASKRR